MSCTETMSSMWDWVDGRSHVQPILGSWDLFYARGRREQAFFNACRAAAPNLAEWPEFKQGLRRFGLEVAYGKGTLSAEVCGLLISERNKSVGSWLKRGSWMKRRGKDPLVRRRGRRADRDFYRVMMEARRLIERHRVLPAVIRETGS